VAPEPATPEPSRLLSRSLTRLDLVVIGLAVALGLMLSMPANSWWRLSLWLFLGLLTYVAWAWFSGRLGGREEISRP